MMKAFLLIGLCVMTASSAAAECITTARGRTVCRDAAGAIVASAPGATAPGAVVVAPSVVAVPGAVVAPRVAAAPAAVVAPHAVVAAQPYARGVGAVHSGYGGAAAYNSRTGNAAVSHTNANGVTTTQTLRGGEAKTKNGMGVAQGPGGKTCAKGRGQAKCN